MKPAIILALALVAASALAEPIMLADGRTIDSEQIKDYAILQARRKFEQKSVGNAGSWVWTTNVDIGEPDPVPGWTDEWRLTGTLGGQSLTTQGGVSSPEMEFDIRVRWKNGRLEVCDFARH